MKILLLITLIGCPLITYSQYTSFGFRYGFGTYKMAELDKLQQLRKDFSGLPLKTTESYPAAPFWRFEIAGNPDKFISKWAFFYTFNSTGARTTASDYSGEYNLDAIINANQLGICFEHNFKLVFPLKLGSYLDLDYMWSKLKTRDYLNLVFPGHSTFITDYVFRASGPSTEAGLRLNYRYKFLKVGFNLGYLFDFSGNFHYAEDKEKWLSIDNNKIGPEWNGIRTGIQIDIIFARKAE